MASGTPGLDIDNVIDTGPIDHRLGTMTWEMDDDVARTFAMLPIDEQNRRKELMKHLLTSAAVVLTCSTVTEDSAVTAVMCRSFDEVANQANRTLLRMTIMT